MDSYERDGLVFDVRDGGPADGPPVVLLHGFPQDAGCWDLVTPFLHKAGLRTLAPNQRGYAAHGAPRSRGAYRMRELVADIMGLLDAAGLERAHLVGHDWGGSVAWVCALVHPERVASLTVLSTPHPQAFAWAMRRPEQVLRSWYMMAFQVPIIPERVLAPRIGDVLQRSGLPQEHADRYAQRFGQPQALSGPIGWYRAMPPPSVAVRRGLRRAMSLVRPLTGVPAAQPQLASRQVQVPTTYLWGRDDVALGRAAAERTGEFVQADYRYVELAAGHWLPETVPRRVAEEIIDRVRRAR